MYSIIEEFIEIRASSHSKPFVTFSHEILFLLGIIKSHSAIYWKLKIKFRNNEIKIQLLQY